MSPLDYLSADFCTRLVTTMLHFLWQATAITILVILIDRMLRKASATLRYGLFLAAFLTMALCPLATFPLTSSPVRETSPVLPQPVAIAHVEDMPQLAPSAARPVPSALPISAFPTLLPRPAVADAPPPVPQPQPQPQLDHWKSLAPVVTGLYLLGVSLLLVRLVAGLHGGRRLRLASQNVTDTALLAMLAARAKAIGLRAVPAVALCSRLAVPVVVGVLRPMVLLPLTLASGLSPQQIEAILTHELAHIRRFDPLVNLLQRLIEAFLFFHPAVWYVSRRIRVERENCCDDLAVAAGAESLAYAQSLLHLAQHSLAGRAHRRSAAAALAAADRPSQLRSRISRLLGSKQEETRLTRTWPAAMLLLVAAGVIIAAASTGSSQSKPDEPTATKPTSSPPTEVADRAAGRIVGTLPNGAEAELVGVCLYGEGEERTWQRPDGAAMDVPVFKAWLHESPGTRFSLLFRINPGEDVVANADHEWSDAASIGPEKDGTWRSSAGAPFHPDVPEKLDYTLSVAAGSWKESKPLTVADLPMTASGPEIDAFVSTVRADPDNTEMSLVDVSYDQDDLDTQLHCKLMNGKTAECGRKSTTRHKNALPGGRAGGAGVGGAAGVFSTGGAENPVPTLIPNERTNVSTFRISARAEDVAEIIVKQRKFNKIEFKNISLRQGQITKVEVVPEMSMQSTTQPANTARPASRPAAEIRVYDVRDVLFSAGLVKPPKGRLSLEGFSEWSDVKELPAEGAAATQNSRPASTKPSSPAILSKQELADRLMDSLRQSVDPQSWEGGHGYGMNYVDGRLVVTQTPENQAAVKAMIDNMRRLAALQVQVEARFLSIPAKDEAKLLEWMSDKLGMKLEAPAAEVGYINQCLDDQQVDSLLLHLQSNSSSSVLSAPRLTVFSGQLADVAVGTQNTFLLPYIGRDTKAIASLTAGTMFKCVATIESDYKGVMLQMAPLVSRLDDDKRDTGASAQPSYNAARGHSMALRVPDQRSFMMRLPMKRIRTAGVADVADTPAELRLEVIATEVSSPNEPQEYVYVLVRPQIISGAATQPASSPTSQPAMRPPTRTTTRPVVDIDPLATKNMLKLDLEDVALEDALERLHKDSGYIIHANWAAMKVISMDPKTPVSVKLEDATLREALDAILTSAAGPGMLRYEYSDKVVQITTAGDAATMGIVVRVYDVRDLMGPVAERTAEDLEKLIHENVAPGTWGPALPRIGSIKFVNKSMIVTQSVEAHEAVTKLLSNLRRQVVKASTAPSTRPSSEPSASAASTLPYAKRSQFDATHRGDH